MYRKVKQLTEIQLNSNALKENFSKYVLDNDLIIDGWEKYLDSTMSVINLYHFDIHNLLETLKVSNEFELISGNVSTMDS